MNWSYFDKEHVNPISLFHVSKDEELRETFNWKNTQPLLKEVHPYKGTKVGFLENRLQFIKTDQILKLNEKA